MNLELAIERLLADFRDRKPVRAKSLLITTPGGWCVAGQPDPVGKTNRIK